jgi:class 3 adenylate cyclase
VVTFGSHPATLRDDDYPWGSTPTEREEIFAALQTLRPYQLTDQLLTVLAPSEAGNPTVRQWWRMFTASASSPVETLEGIRSLGPVDIRGLLGTIQAPVLVLHRTGDRLASVNASRYMAERIPGARLAELPGDDHLPFFGDQDAVVGLTQEFLTGTMPAADPDRVLATVLPKALARHQKPRDPEGDQAGGSGDARAPLTDIVDSTGLAAELGDRRWHRVLVDHQELVRGQLARFRGREVKTTGDGFLASFDGPARAIRAAAAIRAGLRDQGLRVRAGLHTGEVELLGDDIGGIAVHIAARVLAQAGAGEIVCSRTVKDLVAGSGFAFADRGTHRLKGVPDSWQLYAVEPAAA